MVTKTTTTPQPIDFLEKFFIGILVVVFGGIVLHAPLTVGFGTLFPSISPLIKSWKELLLLLDGVVAAIILQKRKRWDIVKHPLLLVIAGYAILHIALIPFYYAGLTQTVAGLFIDLRYLLFFVLVYVALQLYPARRRLFTTIFFVGAFIVAAFALLQIFVLPHDILKYIGYSKQTISPYLTVDENPQYVRINSTLRGPNPLGAYALIVLSLITAFWLRGKKVMLRRPILPVSVVVIGSFAALWASYSRSALLAAAISIAVIVLVTTGKRIPTWLWITGSVVILAIAGGLFTARSNAVISNVLLHENATTGASINSNEGHIDSLEQGVTRIVHQPLGAGIGSTGSASLYGNDGLIIENQYLFVAHETGWLGLIAFSFIFIALLRQLWLRRLDWLALGVFASGLGLGFIGLLLPVWVDDTVSIIWWGLAAIALTPEATLISQTMKKSESHQHHAN